jgi:hypothetical protein
VVGVVMAPFPVISLLVVIGVVELMVLVVFFGQIEAVGPIFAIVPLMVILVIAIIVAGVVPGADDGFLRGLGSQRDDKCRGWRKTKRNAEWIVA